LPGASVPRVEERPPRRVPRVPVRELPRRTLHHRPPSRGGECVARRWGARGTASSTGRPWASWSPGWCSTRIPRRSRPSFGSPVSRRSVPEQLEWDFERFKREWPRDLAAHVREAYRIDLTARYLGEALPHPIGKGSGQLSLSAGQLEDDASAGL